MNLETIHGWSDEEAKGNFFQCCGSARWAEEMTRKRPFSNERILKQVAEEIWQNLDHEDWLEAFAQHPQIGDLESLRAKQEQSGVATASDETLEALAKGNQEYEQKNGFVFLVCATGKSAEEMLSMLEERLQNETEMELEIAAGEQSKITNLRLERIE